MKILTEYKSKEEPKTLEAMSTYGLNIKNFIRGEAVGIYLRELYPATIDLIETLLYFKHPVTLKYESTQYILYTRDEWSKTYQDPRDQLRQITEMHPILKAYKDKCQAYRERKFAEKQNKRYEMFYYNYPELKTMPDEALETYLRDLVTLYELDVDYTDRLSKIQAYVQLKYYIEHGIEPSRLPEGVEVYPIGDTTLMDDIVYNAKEKQIAIDKVLQNVL